MLKSRPASNATTPTIVTGTTNVLPEKYGTEQVTVAQKHEKTGSYSQVHETQTSLLLQADTVNLNRNQDVTVIY